MTTGYILVPIILLFRYTRVSLYSHFRSFLLEEGFLFSAPPPPSFSEVPSFRSLLSPFLEVPSLRYEPALIIVLDDIYFGLYLF